MVVCVLVAVLLNSDCLTDLTAVYVGDYFPRQHPNWNGSSKIVFMGNNSIMVTQYFSQEIHKRLEIKIQSIDSNRLMNDDSMFQR